MKDTSFQTDSTGEPRKSLAEAPATLAEPRMVSVDRARDLLQALADRDGLPGTRPLEGPLLERYAEDGVRRSNVLEPSLSGSGQVVTFYRFSYGFPTFRRDPSRAADTMLRVAQAVGDAAVEATRKIRKAMMQACVEQPIVGFASDAAARRRFKLYLMFRAGADGPARALAREVLGAAMEPAQPGCLHMVGLDVGSAGLTGAKLYFEHPTLELSREYCSRSRELRRALAIHPLTAPDDQSPEPVAIDFAPVDSGLAWADVEEDLARDHRAVTVAFRELCGSFRLQARRVSVSRGASRRLNLYYELADEVTPRDAPG